MQLQPGEYAPKNGTYNVVDNNGNHYYTVDIAKDQKLPPTQSSDYYYEIED